jgi:SAM-dependent methyltransferase
MQSPRILDIGCGPGGQTLELIRQIGGTVIALDTHQPFLDELDAKAGKAGLADNILTMNRSMFEMDFEPGSFDLLWAEGSIYIYGLKKALKDWSILLHKGGCMGITEAVWLRENPPQEAFEFWQAAYPEMHHLSEILDLIPSKDYELLGHFVLPESSWWESYYNPLQSRIDQLRNQYADDIEAQTQLDEEEREIEIYHRYHEWYGYAFFVMQKSKPGR